MQLIDNTAGVLIKSIINTFTPKQSEDFYSYAKTMVCYLFQNYYSFQFQFKLHTTAYM